MGIKSSKISPQGMLTTSNLKSNKVMSSYDIDNISEAQITNKKARDKLVKIPELTKKKDIENIRLSVSDGRSKRKRRKRSKIKRKSISPLKRRRSRSKKLKRR